MKIKILRLLNALLLLTFMVIPRASAHTPQPQDPRISGLGDPITIPEEEIIIHRYPEAPEPYQILLKECINPENIEEIYQLQDTFLDSAEAELGRSLDVFGRDIGEMYSLTLNLLKSEAKQLSTMEGVLQVKRKTDSEEIQPEFTEPVDETQVEETLESPLPVTKTVSQEFPKIGSTITYTITIPSNRTGADLTYAVEDVLPAGVTYVPDSLTTSGSDIPASYDPEYNKITWNGVVPNFDFRYEMSSNSTDPECIMPISDDGTYYDIFSEEGTRTFLEPYGDMIHFTLGDFLGVGMEYFGEIIPLQPIFSDDGLVFMYEDYKYSFMMPENQNLPDPTQPNGILSPWWWDMEIVYDYELNKGVTAEYWTGENPAWLVEFDDIEDWYYDSINMDFEIFAWLEPDHAIGYPDIVFAYDNVTGNWFDPDLDGINIPDGSIGLENVDGTIGYTHTYNSLMPQSGEIVCFDYYEVGREDVVIRFDAIVDLEQTPGTVITNTASYSIDSNPSESATVDITLNDVPVVEDQNLSTDEDIPLLIPLIATDLYPGGTLYYHFPIRPQNGSLSGSSSSPTYTSDLDYYGSDYFTYTVSDGIATSEPGIITISISPVNDPPVITIPGQTIAEGETFAAIPLDNFLSDVDSPIETITWTASGNVDLSVDIDENRVANISIPHIDWFGAETITFSATDDHIETPETGTQDVLLTVTPVNDLHMVSDISDQTINEGETFNIISLDNYVSDVETPPDGFIWTYAGNKDLSVTIDIDRIAVVGLPSTEWYGTEEITFTAIGPEGLTASDAVTFIVNPINSPPKANDDSFQLDEDTTLFLQAADLLQNDTDSDNNLEELSLTDVNNPINGTLDLENETITFTPSVNFYGVAGFDTTISDGAMSDTGHVTVTVNPVNDPLILSEIPSQAINEGESFTPINLDDYVSDVEDSNGEITWSAWGSSELVVAINDDRLASIMPPNQDWHGSETISFTAEDTGGLSESVAAIFTVNPVNDPPIVTDIPSQTVNEDTPFTTIDLRSFVEDVDNQAAELTWSVSGAVDLSVIIDENHIATITPPNGEWHGSETLTFTASDPGGLSDSDTATFRVITVNDPPVVEDIPAQSISEVGTFAAINLDDFVFDPDNADADLTWTYSGNLDLIVSISPDRIATLTTPDVDWNGQETITFTATDPGDLSDTAGAIFTVSAVNDPPVNSLPSNLSVLEDVATPLSPISVSDGDVNESVDGQLELSLEVTSGALSLYQTAGLTFTTGDGLTDPQMVFSGSLADVNLALGSLLYTPESNYVGQATLTLTSSDQGATGEGGALVDTDQLLITVKDNNQAPLATSDDDYTVNEDTTLVVNAPGVLENDTDQDMDPLIAKLISSTTSGSLTLNPDGSFTYLPVKNYTGTDSFSYKASDGTADSETVWVNITIYPVNDPPSAGDDSFTTSEDTTLVKTTAELLANDTNVESDTQTLSVLGVSSPTNGTVSLEDGTITFSPSLNYYGTAGFDYTISDGELSDTGHVTVLVSPVNDPPLVYSIPNPTIDEGSSFTKIYLDNYIDDVDDDITQINWTSSGNSELTVEISSDRVASIIIPNLDWHGSEIITFTAIDDQDGSGQREVTFTVNSINDPPIVVDIPGQTIPEGGSFAIIDLNAFVSDVDHDDSEITWQVSGESNLQVSIDENQIASITPLDEDWFGTETLTFSAADPGHLSDSDTATFRITAVNDPPVVSEIPGQIILEGGIFTVINLDEVVSDVDNTDVDLTWQYSNNQDLIISISPYRIATISTPDVNWNGDETITFTATDPGDLSSAAAATFTVTAVNDPPTAIAQTITTEIGIPVEFTLEGWDVDGDPLTYIVLIPPTNGVLSGEKPNLTYTPNPEWSGEDHLRFIVKDSQYYSNEAKVTIMVERSGWSIYLPLILR